jgi:hypothetical protein
MTTEIRVQSVLLNPCGVVVTFFMIHHHPPSSMEKRSGGREETRAFEKKPMAVEERLKKPRRLN